MQFITETLSAVLINRFQVVSFQVFGQKWWVELLKIVGFIGTQADKTTALNDCIKEDFLRHQYSWYYILLLLLQVSCYWLPTSFSREPCWNFCEERSNLWSCGLQSVYETFQKIGMASSISFFFAGYFFYCYYVENSK